MSPVEPRIEQAHLLIVHPQPPQPGIYMLTSSQSISDNYLLFHSVLICREGVDEPPYQKPWKSPESNNPPVSSDPDCDGVVQLSLSVEFHSCVSHESHVDSGSECDLHPHGPLYYEKQCVPELCM